MIRRLLVAGLATLAIAGCATTPPEEDPVQIRLKDLDTRLARIERVVNNQSLAELAKQVDGLQSEVRSLRGQVEELQNGNESVRKQQRDLYADLDRRLAALESAGKSGAGAAPLPAAAPAAAPAPPATPVGPTNPVAAAGAGAGVGATSVGASPAEQAAYNQAFDLLKSSNYAAATNAFKAFLANYPLSELASDAQYWLGETYYVTRDYDNALAAFQRVVRDWPSSRKAPDALVKLGFTQAELKRYAAARSTLNLVLSQYPGTDAAKLAAERLKNLPAS